ncbi:MAG: efflux transporter outer membrane subunit [Vampirovibrionales bacterium]|nr:efflux transporter outer membrane subunit [Vampirovibrionales bacterium]
MLSGSKKSTLFIALLTGIVLLNGTIAIAKDIALPPATISQQETWVYTPTTKTLATQAVFPDKAWWQASGDPYLIATLEAVLANNNELKGSQAKLLESRALIRETLGGAFPSLTINPSGVRQKNSANLIVPSRAQLSGNGPRLFAPGATINTYSLPLQASWEPDVWLRTLDATQLAKQTLEQSVQDQHQLHVLLITDAATAYWNLIGIDAQLLCLEKALHLAADRLTLEEDRLQAGLINGETIEQAKANRIVLEQQVVQLLTQQATFQNQLAVLMGKTPAQTAQWPRLSYSQWVESPAASLTDTLSVGVPLEVITRRPDLLKAEAQLKAQALQVRLARKAFLPTFNLTGQYGYASTQLSNWLTQSSNLWNIGGNAAIGLFEGGTKWYRLKREKAIQEQTVANYQHAVLTALGDVENSLATVQSAMILATEEAQRLQATTQQTSYQQDRVQAGLLAQADLLPQEQAIAQGEQALVQQRIAAAVARVGVYKALGGGY